MEYYFHPSYHDNTTSTFVNKTIPNDEGVVEFIKDNAKFLSILSILFTGLYVYKIVKQETSQFVNFLPFHIIMYIQLITTLHFFLHLGFKFSLSIISFILTAFHVFFLGSSTFLVMTFCVFQLILAFFDVKFGNEKKWIALGIPVLMVLKMVVEYESDKLKTDVEILECILILIAIILFIFFYIRYQSNRLQFDQKLFCIISNCLLTITLAFIIKTFLIIKLSQHSYFAFKVLTWYFPFLWIISMYISYSKPVQAWIEKNSPKTPEIPMESVIPTVDSELNGRRGSVDTTVSYLSLADVTLEV